MELNKKNYQKFDKKKRTNRTQNRFSKYSHR